MDKFSYHEDDKCIRIVGPFDLAIEVDFDDVCHAQVKHEVKQLVKLLNKHWDKDS